MNRPDDVSLFSGGPLYKEVKRRLTDSLGAAEWKPGEAIPPEPQLAARFGVSIGTLRKAIDELVAENVLLRQQGRGTFVASHRGEAMRFLFFSIVGQDGSQQYPEVRLEGYQRGRADETAADKLALAPKAPVIRFRNSLWLGGEAVGVDDITVPAALFPGLSLTRLQRRDNTIYHLYEHGFGVSVMRIAETLRAVGAPPDVASVLGLEAGSPLLLVRRVAYTLNDRPVEFRLSWVNTARHEYRRDAGS
jgi:GntR family transcriptional regulator